MDIKCIFYDLCMIGFIFDFRKFRPAGTKTAWENFAVN